MRTIDRPMTYAEYLDFMHRWWDSMSDDEVERYLWT